MDFDKKDYTYEESHSLIQSFREFRLSIYWKQGEFN